MKRQLGLSSSSHSTACFLSDGEKKERKLLKEAKKIKKEQNIKLTAEMNALRENEINSIVNDDCDFDDDLSYKEENEVIGI